VAAQTAVEYGPRAGVVDVDCAGGGAEDEGAGRDESRRREGRGGVDGWRGGARRRRGRGGRGCGGLDREAEYAMDESVCGT